MAARSASLAIGVDHSHSHAKPAMPTHFPNARQAGLRAKARSAAHNSAKVSEVPRGEIAAAASFPNIEVS